jgi:hypothetical protein
VTYLLFPTRATSSDLSANPRQNIQHALVFRTVEIRPSRTRLRQSFRCLVGPGPLSFSHDWDDEEIGNGQKESSPVSTPRGFIYVKEGAKRNPGLKKCDCPICQRLDGVEHGIHWRRRGMGQPISRKLPHIIHEVHWGHLGPPPRWKIFRGGNLGDSPKWLEKYVVSLELAEYKVE